MTTPTPMTEDDALAYVDRLRAALDAANVRAEAAEARLNDGCNLVNYSVSGLSVPIGDWLAHIAACRALLGDAYREYDARGK